ncbi:MAG: PaaI family thioesterase [Gammaproteobacteria bacterium]|nr:PaaI family thioesterase [Gammaproteobacteria bacterium]
MTAIQDQLPHNHCYGCGADNPAGMRIKSHWQGDETVCTYTPRPEQCAGPEQYLYGGTIASLIDCHCVGTALSNYYRLAGREPGEGEEIWCVTANLNVDYIAPTPIDRDVTLRATIEECGERKTRVRCRVYSGGTQTAEGTVIAVRVPGDWRNA